MNEPGQPCEKMSGMALGSEERSCTKCSCGKAFHMMLTLLEPNVAQQAARVTTSSSVFAEHHSKHEQVVLAWRINSVKGNHRTAALNGLLHCKVRHSRVAGR